MADELADALGIEPEAVEPAPVEPETVAEPIAEPQSEPEKPAEPEPQPAKPEPGYVPIAAMMDERDRRKAAEARARELEQARQQTEPRRAPDPFDDPDGYAAFQQRATDERFMQMRFEMSEQFARQSHGDDTVTEAIKWATEKSAQDPVFAASYMREQNPIGYIVQQHKREEAMGKLGGKTLDDWFNEEAARRGLNIPSAPAAAAQAVIPHQAAPPVRVPRSLATQGSGPSDVRDVATGPLAAVDAVFPN